MSTSEWIVHTHLGFERHTSEENAELRIDWLRWFFASHSPDDFWIEPNHTQPTKGTP